MTVDVRILDHCGNLVDAACLSALAALLAFRKPQVSIDGGASGCEVVIHPPEEKDPLPLTLHHLPVAISFALFEVRPCSPSVSFLLVCVHSAHWGAGCPSCLLKYGGRGGWLCPLAVSYESCG